MEYFSHMLRILRLDTSVYREIYESELSLRYCVINVFVLGLVYAATVVHLGQQYLVRSSTAGEAAFNPLMIVMVGVSVAFLMHGGAALFVWVFCRGMGGCAHFTPPYLNIGFAAISLWPVAPGLAAYQAGVCAPLCSIGTLGLAAYACTVMFTAVREVSGLSATRMGIAAVATLIYVGCFLYLWI
jgi:hypothetical protein